jgi:hypothetical protein
MIAPTGSLGLAGNVLIAFLRDPSANDVKAAAVHFGV